MKRGTKQKPSAFAIALSNLKPGWHLRLTDAVRSFQTHDLGAEEVARLVSCLLGKHKGQSLHPHSAGMRVGWTGCSSLVRLP